MSLLLLPTYLCKEQEVCALLSFEWVLIVSNILPVDAWTMLKLFVVTHYYDLCHHHTTSCGVTLEF